MKAVIIKTLEESDGAFTLIKLKKTILKDSDLTEEDFDTTIEKLINKGKIGYDNEDKYLQLLKKRKSENEEIDDDSKQLASIEKKTKFENDEITKGSKSLKGLYPELWNTGEKLWRENAFDQNYLLANPDGITRIFCGNLNKNVTEEQLRGFIENIVYIKWITDRETQQFYGSTFLEMKDTKAAITAVMKDKQKFLGR